MVYRTREEVNARRSDELRVISDERNTRKHDFCTIAITEEMHRKYLMFRVKINE
jgi:hypothetical protein